MTASVSVVCIGLDLQSQNSTQVGLHRLWQRKPCTGISVTELRASCCSAALWAVSQWPDQGNAHDRQPYFSPSYLRAGSYRHHSTSYIV